MPASLILASGSAVRAKMLTQAGIDHSIVVPRVDEDSMKTSLLAEAASPRDIADALAEMKARKVSDKIPGSWVIGCDQVLEFRGQILSKPKTPEHAIEQLSMLRGDRHMLLSAVVICENGAPIWRHVGQVRLRMRQFSDNYLRSYVDRNWDSIRHAVGGNKLEEEGVRLFTSIDGDYFNVLGMPLMELLNFLTLRGVIEQ